MSDIELGIKVELKAEEAVIHETLERIGVVDDRNKVIYPSCYLRKLENDEYAIVHFKELFVLQNKPSTFNKLDDLRRSTIAFFLQKWGLISVYHPEDIQRILTKKIDVVSHKDKREYKVVHKFKHNR